MDRTSRAYKILSSLKGQSENMPLENNPLDEDVEFWLKNKKENWFCNRPLSPTNKCSKINIIDDILLVPGEPENENLSREKDKNLTSQADNTEDNEDCSRNDEIHSCSEEPFSDSDEDPLYIPPSSDENGESVSSQTSNIIQVSDSSPTAAGCSDEQNGNNLCEVLHEPEDIIELTTNNDEKNKSERTKSKYQRKPDFCYFCETEVQNFVRHITRNHNHEPEVAEILAKPKLNKERRHLLDILRRKGNYLSSADKCFKPVRTPSHNLNLLPCDNCLGFFSSKLLYRHRKKCNKNKPNHNAQAAGQSQLVSHLRIDKHLKEQVFPRMRADKVSLTAKKDSLICAFGTRYLKSHREKHFINVTSRKMRELARVLIEVQKMEPSIKNMFDALQCKHFDVIVAACKIVARFNEQDDRYESPTFAMNIATSLKQCCDIAINFALKKQGQYANITSAEAETNLKTMIHLINTNWKFEISTQAAENLNLNKWNKITIIPLASDLKIMRQYLIKKSEDALTKLKINQHDTSAFNTLMETVFCRVLLLNRRRPGELQRMLMHTYINVEQNTQHYEEFDNAISPTEKMLLKKMKRIIIRGKRGRGVPVLFSEDIQQHIKLLLQVRNNFVTSDNIYLFSKSGLTTPIAGYKVLSKYAKDCGAKNHRAITSTRLRKHLATISQVFNLQENELEQLATFMGHTEGIHKKSYRLPDDVYQTAKISKVLLLMEKGEINNYKGKTLEDIDVNLDEELINENEVSDDQDETEQFVDSSCSSQFQASCSSNNEEAPTENPGIKKGRRRVLVPWSSQQKTLVKKYFKKHINNKQAPKRTECENLRQKYPDVFLNKDWLKIKVFVQNQYVKSK